MWVRFVKFLIVMDNIENLTGDDDWGCVVNRRTLCLYPGVIKYIIFHGQSPG